MDGYEIAQIPAVKFSGKTPIQLVTAGIKKSSYSDELSAEPDLDAIRLQFDVPVDHASAEAAFSITPAIPGSFQWEKVENTSKEFLVYVFHELLDRSTAYTVKVDSSLLTPAGERAMIEPFQLEFNSPHWGYIVPSFGEAGDNIQVVDANGPRRIQISGNDPDISFTAYSFDLSEYAALYAEHYRSRSGSVRSIPIPADLQPALTWKQTVSREIKDSSITETILPPELPPGLYVVNLKVKNRLYDRLFVVISENTLVVKNDGDDLFVWLTNINGGVVADAEVRVYNSKGEKIREGHTNENGQYQVSVPPDAEPMLVSAFVKAPGQPNDVIVTGFSSWRSRIYYDYYEQWDEWQLPEGKSYLTYIYTERPLYRPGQTVNFKVILRKDDDVKYSLLETGTPVDVQVKDARGNVIATYEMATNEFGTIHGSVDISEGAMLGEYKIEAEVEGVIFEESFKVEDYRKPDYQISITSLQPEKQDRFVQGEEVRLQIHAAYYFGEPLANAKLDVDVMEGYSPLAISLSTSLKTDEDGNAILSFKAPFNFNSYESSTWWRRQNPQTIQLTASIDDGSNQSVAAVHQFLVYPAAEILSLNTDGYFFKPNQPFSVSIRVTNLFEQPIVGRDVSLTIHPWNRENYKFGSVIQSFSLQTDSQGQAAQELVFPSSGYYQLSLHARDADGHKMETRRVVYVFKQNDRWFTTRQTDQIQILAERDSYKPYEKARFMIESTFSGLALITFERGSVINSKLIELTAPLTVFETDVIPEHAPNVYVTVHAWQPAAEDVYRYGYLDLWTTDADSYLRIDDTQIRVDASAKELDIRITTDKQTYQPGETVTATINVKDSQGNPAPAELSLAVVDESIYALASEFEPDIFDAFYGPRQHTVATSDSMSPYRVIMEGGRGGGGGGGALKTRQDFLDTSAWLPVIQTNENGQGIVTFELPDNTTSWRLTVKAITLKHQVGQAKTNIETKKEIFLRPVLPRVLTRGDQATLATFIHNYSPEEKTLTLQFIADGLKIEDGDEEQTVTLQPGEVMPVGWRIVVDRATPTKIKFIARDEKGVLDAVEMPMLIQPAAVRDIQTQSGEFTGTLALEVALPAVEMETSQVTLSLHQSMSGTLLNGLEYLIGFPYGCVEQTMSRALPNAVILRASEQLGIGGPNLQRRLEPYIEESISKLYSLQHGDGGWGWWQYDASDEYQTAWVLFGLGIINDSGHTVAPTVLDDAARWLNDSLRYRDMDPRTRAYALYSLAAAGRGNLEATQNLVSESIHELDPFSQAALASALHKMGETKQAREILELLAQSATKTKDEVYWSQPAYDGVYNRKTMASTTRTTAMVLLAYAEIDPQNELVPGMVEYLSSQRRGSYGWGTTNETSFAILALTEYLVSQENSSGVTPYQVSVNGRELFTGTLKPGDTSVTLEIPISELEHGVNSLLVDTQGDHPVYFDLSTKYDLMQKDVEAAGAVKITRRYLDPKTGKPLESLQAGQLVKVELIVNFSEQAYFVAVEDYLPGGLEALNEELGMSNQYHENEWEFFPYFWEDYGYNYKEIRGDRVVFFITELEPGRHTFTYFARATTTGQFTALPAQAYAMYDLNTWGRSDSLEITVK
ncbi:MAG: hypothetical protein DPW18_10025 [Chloroflexi bacterium]|nr:hypothetical protein [Chloroflexota bacterium]MDL1943315.1 hypothetical protein [Chloroflexi bacterium CFX2]